jgi:hypothetical protein
VLKPFEPHLPLYVYEDGNMIDFREVKNDSSFVELSDTIFILSEKHQIKDIEMVGSPQYIKGIIKKIKEAETAKYNKNELNFILYK